MCPMGPMGPMGPMRLMGLMGLMGLIVHARRPSRFQWGIATARERSRNPINRIQERTPWTQK
jgi:hypothetical protein